MSLPTTTNMLKPTLGPIQLWGIAVGLVISGEYFGWSYGWGVAGTLGFLVTTLMIATMYSCFIFSYTELTTAIPHAGGPFAFSRRAFGEFGGMIAGMATLIEFVFAPPAIALAIGAYLNVQYPALDPQLAAIGAYVIFMTLNILGVKLAAMFELLVTSLAVIELLVFMGVVAPGFSLANFVANGWAGSDAFSATAISGIFAAIPFAIWFFLAIEGAAMAAEETRDPRRTIPKAYVSGIILGYSRQFFALARAGYLPRGLARLSRFRTPHRAILAGGVIGVAAILSDGRFDLQGMSLTAAMITMAVFGAIVMYVMSMLSLFRLRRIEPELERWYRAPGYPAVPLVALIMALVCLVAMLWFKPTIALLFVGLMLLGGLYFALTRTQRREAEDALDPIS
ncbi:amino acid permease [Salinicola socius]|uniref:Ethanolamine transporter n=1 Tax=Salinicola socius TaxID=404433 RepID=A0A1Q8SR83_9GAMM|nr:amino acid permease [Salinicola socius]OLO03935.1 ethanolamine transporter [Salinicola socius]